ncbi:Alpha-(1,3)-fucosyltransferase 11 [Mortierella sp. GBA35]|nr:Alpha-(1,3)-fucosyltransferase 11 [Mortierella sp. GBA35]
MSINNPAAAAAAAAPISTKEYPILWWTTWFWADEKEGWLIDKCGLPYNCRMTHNRAVYNEASTIVFHGSMFHENLKDLPPLEDAQSDIVETYFGSGRTGNLSYLKSIMVKPAYTIQEKNQFRRGGEGEGAGREGDQGNCKADNKRHYFVKQLQKHIPVDIYGRAQCMSNREWPKHPDGEDFTSFEIVSRYKFYLLERPFEAGVVPIVDGLHDYSPFIPTPDSVINMDAFNGSPKGLAEYIRMLDQDDEAYLQLLRYKFPGNVTVAQTLDHLSPSLRSYYDTGDNHSDWGVDGRGATGALTAVARCARCASSPTISPRALSTSSRVDPQDPTFEHL